LFSPEDDEYAFRETDRGTRNLAFFVAEETRGCRFAFIEGQLYFMRIMSDSPEIRTSFDERAVRKDRRPLWSEAIRRMINQVPPYWRTFLQRAKKMKHRLPEMPNRWSKFLLTLKYHFSATVGEIGAALVSTYQRFRKGRGEIASSRDQAMPYPPPLVELDRAARFKFIRHRRQEHHPIGDGDPRPGAAKALLDLVVQRLTKFRYSGVHQDKSVPM
jgi:hypothetical protein